MSLHCDEINLHNLKSFQGQELIFPSADTESAKQMTLCNYQGNEWMKRTKTVRLLFTATCLLKGKWLQMTLKYVKGLIFLLDLFLMTEVPVSVTAFWKSQIKDSSNGHLQKQKLKALSIGSMSIYIGKCSSNFIPKMGGLSDVNYTSVRLFFKS